MQIPAQAGRWSRSKFGVIATLVFFVCFAAALPAQRAQAVIVDTVTYSSDTSLVLSGVPVTLTILSGSTHGDSLTVNSTNFTLPASIVGTLTIRYTGTPTPKSFTDGTFNYCTHVGGNNDFAFTSAHVNKIISISAVDCNPPATGGGGGGGYTTPFVTLSAPNGGQTLAPGTVYSVTWSAGGSGLAGIRLSLSSDSGATYPTAVVASTYNSSYYSWTVPDIATTQARLKAEVVDSGGTALAADSSDSDFTITGTQPPPAPPAEEEPAEEPGAEEPAEEPGAAETPTTSEAIAAAEAGAPASDSNTSGSYSPADATTNTPTINVDMQLQAPPPDKPALCASGSLIKGSGAAVYFCGKNGKRYVFVNEGAFYSWYKDFSSVQQISDSLLSQIQLGGNITYKPGVRMVKIQSDPKVYAVARGGLLRWVQTEAVALALYGSDWNKKIDDVSDAFFFSYQIGPPIGTCEAQAGAGDLGGTTPCFSEGTAVAIGTKG